VCARCNQALTTRLPYRFGISEKTFHLCQRGGGLCGQIKLMAQAGIFCLVALALLIRAQRVFGGHFPETELVPSLFRDV
jgi:hypothetical protein